MDVQLGITLTTYVLVHGGDRDGSIWDKVANLLRKTGHQVYSPSMTSVKKSTVEENIAEVISYIKSNQLTNFILVGHSYLLVLGIVHTVAAFILYYQSVKKLPTTTIAVISYVDPIVAIFTDVLFYNRELNSLQIAGIVITLVSSYFVITPEGFKKFFRS